MRRLSGPEQRARGGSRGFGVPELYREQHDIDRANLGGVIGDVRLRQMKIAVHALDLQAVLLDRVAVGAARDEKDIVPRRGKPRTEITADRARRHRRNTHDLSSTLFGAGRYTGPPDSGQPGKKNGPAQWPEVYGAKQAVHDKPNCRA